MSIDERRAFFRTNLWRPDPPTADSGPKNLRQVWFPGVHCDVGGGYPEAQSGLSKFALEWMAREAALAGLLVDRSRLDEVMGRTGTKFAKADCDAALHESLTAWWRTAEIMPKRHWNWQTQSEERRMNLGRRRTLRPIRSFTRRLSTARGTACPTMQSELIRRLGEMLEQPLHGLLSTTKWWRTPVRSVPVTRLFGHFLESQRHMCHGVTGEPMRTAELLLGVGPVIGL